jgi:hypothetical protein
VFGVGADLGARRTGTGLNQPPKVCSDATVPTTAWASLVSWRRISWTAFAEDVLVEGVTGLSVADMRQYLQYVADRRLMAMGWTPEYEVDNPFPFMDLQDVQELSNFFKRRVSAYQIGVKGEVSFDEEF